MLRVLASFLAVCVVSTAAAAQPVPAAESSIPPGLKDWRAWVLKDLDYRACPSSARAHLRQVEPLIIGSYQLRFVLLGEDFLQTSNGSRLAG